MSMSSLRRPAQSSLNKHVSETNKPNGTFEQESKSAITQKLLDQNATESEQEVVTEDRNPNQFDVLEPMDIDDEHSLITTTKIEKSIGFGNETLHLSIDISEPMDIDEEEEEVKVINAF